MSSITTLQGRRLLTIALVFACVMAGGAALWQISKLRAEASSSKASARDQQALQTRLRRGVGSEVRFASTAAKPEQIAEAVSSTADFIYRRSGLKMSEETKKQLVEAETNVLQAGANPTTIEALTDGLTAVVTERLATLTDEEIVVATELSSNEAGEVWFRVNGRKGVLTQNELIQQAKAGRESSKRGDSVLAYTLRSMVQREMSARVSTLSSALPAQFGKASAQGITPTQALLIAYSVVTNDPLTDSQSDIDQMIVQQRIDAGQTREQRQAQRNVTGRPYGPHGFLHPSAPHLFLNQVTIGSLLNLSEGGKK